MNEALTAPFPWFGGKSRVAPQVWRALGDVEHYVEPFAGSLAVLLGRPAEHTGTLETVNDLDAHLCNFWRAVQRDPQGVARYANSPVNEADLTARHIWLVNTGAERVARLMGDPDYYDVQTAGWWVWGICAWIGGGWCAGGGPWTAVEGRLARADGGQGVNRQRVHLSAGQGINRLNWRGDTAAGTDTGLAKMTAYMQALAARLRYVRVCCGDWRRVVTPGALAHGSTVGIYLDPPYAADLRAGELYNTDQLNGATVSAAVREWCLKNGDNPRYRIVLCGYEGEHDMPASWRVIAWKANRAYGRQHGPTANSDNRHRERLWLSPGCLKAGQMQLFGG